MPSKNHNRQYDLVLFGATGYTGQITAEQIVTHLPVDLKWAIAGRSEAKLRDLAAGCKELNSDRSQPAIEIYNLNDEELSALVKKTFVLITTVGPYAQYGEHAFKACAENGTHYLDVTGEIPWTFKMLKKYEETAKKSGAMMIPQIGLESTPSDILTWSMATAIRTQLLAHTADVTVSVHNLSSAPSGGTLLTTLGYYKNMTTEQRAACQRDYAMSPILNPKPRPGIPLFARLTGMSRVPRLGLLTTSFGAMPNVPIVERTWGLLPTIPSRRDQFYGPNFSFAEKFRAKNWLHGLVVHYGLIILGILLAVTGPVKTLIMKLAFQPGHGPEKEAAKKDYIEFRGVANTDPPSKKQAFCRASYAGSMYYLTGVFAAHAAQTILVDDLKLSGGVYTPACLGQGFIDRASAAGFQIEVDIVDRLERV